MKLVYPNSSEAPIMLLPTADRIQSDKSPQFTFEIQIQSQPAAWIYSSVQMIQITNNQSTQYKAGA